MSNVWYRNGKRYFAFPQDFIANDGMQKVGPAATSLYLYLTYLADRKSKVKVHLSAAEIEGRTGISKNASTRARKALIQHGFLVAERTGDGYHYTLADANTGKALSNSSAGVEQYLKLEELKPDQLDAYYDHHLKGPKIPNAKGFKTHCPFHADDKESLSVTVTKPRSAWFCHGCRAGGNIVDFESALAKLAGQKIPLRQTISRIRRVLVDAGAITSTSNEPTEVYPYRNSGGNVVFEVCRYVPKAFKQRRPDPDRPGYYIYNTDSCEHCLYNLPEVIAAGTVIVCEGEKDANRLNAIGLRDRDYGPIVATTCPNGAGKWLPSHSKSLAGKRVVLIPDQDKHGREHGNDIRRSLEGIADVKIVLLPDPYKDPSAYLAENVEEQFVQLLPQGWIEYGGIADI